MNELMNDLKHFQTTGEQPEDPKAYLLKEVEEKAKTAKTKKWEILLSYKPDFSKLSRNSLEDILDDLNGYKYTPIATLSNLLK